MPEWMAVLIGALAVIAVQGLTAAYVYGQLTARVTAVCKGVEDHTLRLAKFETVLSGSGGHGERLVALEARLLEDRAQIHT